MLCYFNYYGNLAYVKQRPSVLCRFFHTSKESVEGTVLGSRPALVPYI